MTSRGGSRATRRRPLKRGSPAAVLAPVAATTLNLDFTNLDVLAA
jgi:hypothetical protein